MRRQSIKVLLVMVSLLIWVELLTGQKLINQNPLQYHQPQLHAKRNPLDGTILNSNPTDTGDSLNVRLVGRWANGPCYAIVVVGDTAYLGNGAYLEIVDFSNPTNPIKLGEVLLPSIVQDIAVVENYAYAANDESGLHIVDISNVANPSVVSSISTNGVAASITSKGDYVYVANDNFSRNSASLCLINVSNKISPQFISLFKTEDFPHDVAVEGRYVYTVNGYKGLRVIDVSSPEFPQEVGFIDTIGCAQSIEVIDNIAYIASNRRLIIIDVTDPSKPYALGSFDVNGIAITVTIFDNLAYMASGDDGLYLIDISIPTNPTKLGHIMNVFGSDVTVNGNVAYMIDGWNGLRIFDVTIPGSSKEVGLFNTYDITYEVVTANNFLYAASGRSGLRIFDISDPKSFYEISFSECEIATSIALDENYAYVTEWYGGLKVIDISDPYDPIEVGFCDLDYNSVDVAISKDHAYVAELHGGLRIIDISIPNNPRLVGSLGTGVSTGIATNGNYLYLACDLEGLKVIDVSNPTNPQLLGYFNTNGEAIGVTFRGKYAYVADYNTGLRVIDVSNPAKPREVGYLNTDGRAYAVAISGEYAYLADDFDGLRIIDISISDNPREVGFFDTGGSAQSVSISGNYAYVADASDGIYILEYFGNPPKSPNLTYPINNSYISDDFPSLNWYVPVDKDSDSLYFKVEIATDNSFINQLSNSPFESQKNSSGFLPKPPVLQGTGSCSFTPLTNLVEGTYWWRVTAWDRKVYGSASDIWKFTVFKDSLSSTGSPAITILPDSSFVVIWQDNRNGNPDIYLQFYNSEGQPQGINLRVNDDNAGAEQFEPAISSAADGSFVVAWTDKRHGDPDIYLQRFDNTGQPLGVNLKVNNDLMKANQDYPAVSSAADGSFVVVWQDNRSGSYDIFGQRFDSWGQVLGSNFSVTSDTSHAYQLFPDASFAADGSFTVVWADDRDDVNFDIYFQRFNSAGQRIGSFTKANDDTSNAAQLYPSISTASDGSFVLAWADDRYGDNDIVLQRFNNSGQALGRNNLVNDDGTSSAQTAPSISFQPDGSFLVTWSDNRDGNYDIFHQRYSISGQKLGSNTKVNDDETNASQEFPDIAAASDGSFIIVWQDMRKDDYDIYFQRYDNMGQVLGNNLKVNFGIPDIDLSKLVESFGEVIVGTIASSLAIQIRNIGTDTLEIHGIHSATGTPIFNGKCEPSKIQVDGWSPLLITFSPIAEQFYTDTLRIYSSDPDEPVTKVHVSGIGILSEPSVLPNLFTPNNDGYNDYVEFRYVSLFDQKPIVKIFNLRGRKVCELNNFSGFISKGVVYQWHGKDEDGKELEPGVYIYIWEIDGKRISSGTLTLMR